MICILSIILLESYRWPYSRKGGAVKDIRLTEEQESMIETLSRALPYLRKEVKISQTELANKVGVSRQLISLIELGKQKMTWTLFLAIVFFFKCNNDFNKRQRKIIKKYPNVVEQMMLLEDNMSQINKASRRTQQ